MYTVKTTPSPDPYGFKRVSSRKVSKSSKIPKTIFEFGIYNIKLENKRTRYGCVKRRYQTFNENRNKLYELTLDSDAIWEREEKREQVECGVILKFVYITLCKCIDFFYDERPIERFWFLEVVARMPYISYVTVLHFYETMGWWSIDSNLREMHTKEDINEGFHLMVMESLGGARKWSDRFLARHTAIAYYVVLVILYLLSPSTAYKSSELLEMHAVDTYRQFVEENEEILSELPPPSITNSKYYVENLRQLFWLITSDELKHANNMKELNQGS